MREPEITPRRRRFPPPPARRRSLVVVDCPDFKAVGRTLALDGATYTFGRDVVGPGAIFDPHLSGQHVRIWPAVGPRGYSIADLDTENGTYVNGAAVLGARALHAHDVICMGSTLLVVDEEPEPDSLPVSADADPAEVLELAGISHAADRIRRAIASVARAQGPVLLLGPSGAGKEVAANAIHRLSGRKGPFIAVNCAAIPTELAESELFGHSKGAFTGAFTDKDGFFLRANRGTLFLDEIGDLAPSLQAKLLRILEDGTLQQVGANTEQKIDVRILAATRADLAHAFRSDLYARLSEYVLFLPPLSDRRADVLVLWDQFQSQIAMAGAPLRARTPSFSEALLLHPWPMNVRELFKLARRLATFGRQGEVFDVHHLPQELQARLGEENAQPIARQLGRKAAATEESEVGPGRAALEHLLHSSEGNIAQVAAELRCHRQQVYRWIKRLGLDVRQYRRAAARLRRSNLQARGRANDNT